MGFRRQRMVVLILALAAGVALIALYVYFPALWPGSRLELRHGRTYTFNEAGGRQALDCFSVVKDRIVAHTFANGYGAADSDRPLYIEATSVESLLHQVTKGVPDTNEEWMQGILNVAIEQYEPTALQKLIVDTDAIPYRTLHTVNDFILPPKSIFYRIINGYRFIDMPSGGKLVLGAAVSQSNFAFLLHVPGRVEVAYGSYDDPVTKVDVTKLLESRNSIHECYRRTITGAVTEIEKISSENWDKRDGGLNEAELKDFNLLSSFAKIFYCNNDIVLYSWPQGILIIINGTKAKAYAIHNDIIRDSISGWEKRYLPENLVTGDGRFVYFGVIDKVNWQEAELYRMSLSGLALGSPERVGMMKIESQVARLEVIGDRIFTESQKWTSGEQRQTIVHSYRLIERRRGAARGTSQT